MVLCNQLLSKSNSKNIILKLGGDGVVVHSKIKKNNYFTDEIEALNTNPKDTAGAGDSMLVASAMSLYTHNNIFQSSYIGSLASAIQIDRIGNVPLSFEELKSVILG